MNKSLITNLVSIFIIVIGFLYRDDFSFILLVGVFALSGSVTNWLAIHMLFEKIPFLYGSGVILDRFEDIKLGIKNLILQELFSIDQIEKFILICRLITLVQQQLDFLKHLTIQYQLLQHPQEPYKLVGFFYHLHHQEFQ